MTKDKRFEMISEAILSTHNELLIEAWDNIRNCHPSYWAENATVAEVRKIEQGCNGEYPDDTTDGTLHNSENI